MVLLVAGLLGGLASAAVDPAKVGPPRSMAAVGDSISLGYNTVPQQPGAARQNAWTTGESTQVQSHYLRLLALEPAIEGQRLNVAVAGREMGDFAAQARAIVSDGTAEYVTVLLGPNDICEPSEAGMTSVEDFRERFAAGMRVLSRGLPDARIYVVSVPDLYQLFALFRNNTRARAIWGIASLCQTVLGYPLSNSAADEERRARVRQRIIDYNAQLRAVCAEYVHCRYDRDAAFNYQFRTVDVSAFDYFHPSVEGQRALAAKTFAAGFRYSDLVAPMTRWQLTATPEGIRLTLKAADNVAVRGIEYRGGGGEWARYDGPLPVMPGDRIVYRAVDVNGNIEGSVALVIPADVPSGGMLDPGESFPPGWDPDAQEPEPDPDVDPVPEPEPEPGSPSEPPAEGGSEPPGANAPGSPWEGELAQGCGCQGGAGGSWMALVALLLGAGRLRLKGRR